MPSRRFDRYESNGGHHLIMQILESHAIQDLIKAISDFFRHGARDKEPRDERECRQHRKEQRRRKPRRRHFYEDGARYEGRREPRRHRQRGRSRYHDGPVHVPNHRVQHTDNVKVQTLTQAPKITPAILIIIIHQDARSAARLHIEGRDQDLHQATCPHISTPAPASLATEIEEMVTSSECRWMSQALVNTSRDRMILGPTLNQGADRHQLPEAGNAEQFRRVKSIARLLMVLVLTTDRREDLHETPETCTVRRCPGAKSSAGTIRHSDQERLGRDPRDHTEVNEVREDKKTERGTMTIVIGTE